MAFARIWKDAFAVTLLVPYSGWLESFWLIYLWYFLDKVKLAVTITNQWLPTLPRHADIALMDHFVHQGYKASQLTRLNRCHIYLQVITLTDIASADGTCIIPDVFIGLPLTDRKSTLQWPSQQRPSETDWALWSSALQSLQPRNRLTTPLGNWLVAEFHQTWFWLRDPHLPHLYRRTTSNTQWEVFRGYTSSVRHTRSTPSLVFNLEEGEVVPVAPTSLCPASVITDRYTKLSTASIGPPFVPPCLYPTKARPPLLCLFTRVT
jgi:hypothetical protein